MDITKEFMTETAMKPTTVIHLDDEAIVYGGFGTL